METEKQVTKNVVLPNVPSQLIRIALVDIEECEKAERVEIDMDQWHSVTFDLDSEHNLIYTGCKVCFAGAVMRQRLQVPDSEDSGPGLFPEHMGHLDALNNFRRGWVSVGFDCLKLYGPEGCSGEHYKTIERQFDRDVTAYEDDPEQFKADMRKLADDLEAAGY